MNLNKMLCLVVAVLASVALVQIGVLWNNKPKATHIASWKHSPNSLQEAKQLAKKGAITGVVTKVEPGSPLIVKAPSEPGGQDTIPVEVATVKVEEAHKGATAGQEMKVFRTGSTAAPSPFNRPAPTGPAPAKPAGGVDKPAQPPMPTEAQAKTVLLEDDPPYKVGQKVHLLLDDGPDVVVAGAPVKTVRPVSPEGRFLETPDKKLQPMSSKAFAQQLKNLPEAQFKGMLK
ncbi:MAG: hypothetical protein ACREJ6_07600 [Candidatus Methylomirabilis sp.]